MLEFIESVLAAKLLASEEPEVGVGVGKRGNDRYQPERGMEAGLEK